MPFANESAIMPPMIRWKKRLLKIAGGFFVLLLLLTAALYFFPKTFLCVDSGPVRADVIIVLGGGSHERPVRAAELFDQQAAPRILISGAGDYGINRHILITNGIPSAKIGVEDQSRTTRENAEFSYKMLQAENVHSAILVTSWYHSRRALKTFEHFAPGIKFYSRPSYFGLNHVPWSRDYSKRVYLEYIKLPGYWVGYGVWPL
ncbi:MAG TPA: YdcF family protein [Candidatus Acidoferrum sp.]|nr:YdcF family protein [Candidatus Acidoferrum sp.]